MDIDRLWLGHQLDERRPVVIHFKCISFDALVENMMKHERWDRHEQPLSGPVPLSRYEGVR